MWDSIVKFLEMITKEYPNYIRLLVLMIFVALLVSELRRIVDWIKESKSLIKLLEIILIVFLLLVTCHCFIEYLSGVGDTALYIHPLVMLIIFISTTFISIIVYVIAIYILGVMELQK